jgi:hypothetical protein
MTIRRRSQIANRFRKMRGLDYSEKKTLIRIGELIDASVNNRGPANPAALSPLRRTLRTKKLPPPTNLRATVGVRSAKIEWDSVDSSILLMYEVQVVNTETNLTTFHSAFTTRHYIGQSGTFTIKVRSVARNGFASPWNFVPITITIQRDVLFLEGNKHEPTAQNYFISEDIFTPSEYKVFCWTAYTLDTFSDPLSNPEFPTDFSRADLYPVYSRLIMPRESVSLSNVAPGVLGVETRPSTRTEGLFESPFGAMFKPFSISSTDSFRDQENTFFVFNDRNDNAGLSISLLSIPAIVQTIETEETLPGYSIDFSGGVGDAEHMQTTSASTLGRESHKWLYPIAPGVFSFEIWVKNEEPDDTKGSVMTFMSHASGFGNAIFQIGRGGSAVGSFTSPTQNSLWIFVQQIFGFGQPRIEGYYDVPIFNNTNWHQIVVTSTHDSSIAGANRNLQVYIDGQDVGSPRTTTPNWVVSNLNRTSLTFPNVERQLVVGGALGFPSVLQWNGLWYSLASWRTVLNSSEVAVLYANPRNDRRTKFGSYDKNRYLVHYYLPALARDAEDDADLGIDWGPGPPYRVLNRTNITIKDDLVGDAPGS